MRIQPATMQQAFEAFHDRYVVKARRAWDLNHHARLWGEAQRAFADHDLAGFAGVYDELRSHWQLARGKGAEMATPENVFKVLCDLPAPLRQARLAHQTESAAPSLLSAVESLACVKQVKGVPSMMAISKILHFFNPRLFVIVDRGMVWNWALNHLWLWQPIKAIDESLRLTLRTSCKVAKDGACDPIAYVAILVWAGSLLRDNPEIPMNFARYLGSKCSADQLTPDLKTYEAVALEWLLLGFVELPPVGVIA